MRNVPVFCLLATLAACSSGRVSGVDAPFGDPADAAGAEHDTADDGDCSGDGDTGLEPFPFPEALAPHDGYWLAFFDHTHNDVTFPVMLIHDQRVDESTGRVTVYSQAIPPTFVHSPPQLEPGQCAEDPLGFVCAHPDAVYLNGSGPQLDSADGTGSWWVKHTWVVDGPGDTHCPVFPAQASYSDCIDAEGVAPGGRHHRAGRRALSARTRIACWERPGGPSADHQGFARAGP